MMIRMNLSTRRSINVPSSDHGHTFFYIEIRLIYEIFKKKTYSEV